MRIQGDLKMRRNCLVLTTIVIGCLLLLQAGCREHTVEAPKGRIDSAAPEQAAERAQERTSRLPNESEPKISFEKRLFDFGEVGPATKNLCEFKFTNAGGGLLKIEGIRPACSCTVAGLAKKDYAPGESGTIKVEYVAGRYLGAVVRSIYVSSNDEKNPRIELTLKAKIVLKVNCQPKRLSLFPGRDNAGCPRLVLSSVDNKPFSITYFRSWPDCITAEFDPLVKSPKFVLKPRVDTDRLPANSSGRIEIGLTHPQAGSVTIPFNVMSKFKISPPSFVIYNAEPQKPVTKYIWVFSNYGEDFEIESVSSQKNIIKVLNQEKVGKRYRFQVQITPPAHRAGQPRFTDTFIVSIKGAGRLKSTCKGYYSKKLSSQ